jgi:hypothetical protein
MSKLELVEPTFVLRASDPLAPSLIRQWARRRELAIAKGHAPDGDLGEVARARQLAIDMELWAQRDALRQHHEAMVRFRKRFPASAEVIKFRKPE